jgi:hypothetical protein
LPSSIVTNTAIAKSIPRQTFDALGPDSWLNTSGGNASGITLTSTRALPVQSYNMGALLGS